MSINIAKYYWCVNVDKKLSKSGKILLNADEVEIISNNLVFWRIKNEKKFQILCIADSFWNFFYAASHIDGSAYLVEHWIEEGKE